MAPRIDSLSNHQVSEGQSIFAYGSGFVDVTGVQVGTEWATSFVVDGDTIITFTTPHQPGGSTNWVVVHLADGTTSPAEGDPQMVTYDSILEPPAGALTIDSIVPDTITLGRADTYWVMGTGLSQTHIVTLGNDAPTFETYDDTRVMLHVHELPLDSGASLELTIFAGEHHATLTVNTAVAEEPEKPYDRPVIFSVEPMTLPAGGGQITIHGDDFQYVTTAAVGGVAATIDSLERTQIVATVGSLAEHVGQTVGVEVIDSNTSSGLSSNHEITVTAS
jgi:hypothetical protein